MEGGIDREDDEDDFCSSLYVYSFSAKKEMQLCEDVEGVEVHYCKHYVLQQFCIAKVLYCRFRGMVDQCYSSSTMTMVALK